MTKAKTEARCKYVAAADDDDGSSSGTATTKAVKPHPHKTVVITSLAGHVTVELEGLAEAEVSKEHRHCSRGYFLVVVDTHNVRTFYKKTIPFFLIG